MGFRVEKAGYRERLFSKESEMVDSNWNISKKWKFGMGQKSIENADRMRSFKWEIEQGFEN